MTNQAKSCRATIVPSLRYRNALAAIDWLVRAFGFEKQAVFLGPDNTTVMHAQLTFGNGMVMLGSVDNGGEVANLIVQPDEIGLRETKGIYLIVTDADAVHATARARRRRDASSTSATWTTAAAPSPAATSKAISGTSAPTTHGTRPSPNRGGVKTTRPPSVVFSPHGTKSVRQVP